MISKLELDVRLLRTDTFGQLLAVHNSLEAVRQLESPRRMLPVVSVNIKVNQRAEGRVLCQRARERARELRS